MSSATWVSVIFGVMLPALAAIAVAGKWRAGAESSAWGSFFGGLLAGVALLVVLPEVWSEFGWLAAGFTLLALVDRLVHPLCAGCDGGPAGWRTLPLWAALGVHALLDGALIEMAPAGSLPAWILLGHRVPEVLAMMALVQTAVPAPRRAGWAVAALQVPVLAGLLLGAELNRSMLLQGYAMVGGAVLFLAMHRLHRSWRQSTLRWGPSLSGAAGVGMVRLGLEWLGRY